MKATTVVSALAALIILFAATRCAKAEPVEIAGQMWEPWPEAPVCERVVWVKKEWAEIRFACGAFACAGPSSAIPACHVFSGYSEEEARSVMAYGESLYQHEARHILERLRHPATKQASTSR